MRACLLLLCLAACSNADTRVLTVLGASSLTDAFTDLKYTFEQDNPGSRVRVSFAGSQVLATQVRQGLEGDVLATANPLHLHALHGEGLASAPRTFARNTLVLAVPRSSTLDLTRLPEAGKLVIGTPHVPLGRYTDQLLDTAQRTHGDDWRAAVNATVVSREANARRVLAKISMGEADAAIVYKTDVHAAVGLKGVALVDSPTADYVHATIKGGPTPSLADRWLAFVHAKRGQQILARHGFDSP